MRINLRAVIPALIVGSLTAIPSFAAPVTGPINLGVNGALQIIDTSILFGESQNSGPYVPGGMGVFTTTPPINSIFSANGVSANETGKILSLSGAVEPPGQTITPVLFMTFDTGGSNLQLYLTKVLAGSLVLGGNPTPFSLTTAANGETASFSVDGYIRNTTNGSITGFTGLFDNTFVGFTEASLIAAATSSSGLITPYSGTFSVTLTPEPASLLLMGVGLLGAGIIARKKVRS